VDRKIIYGEGLFIYVHVSMRVANYWKSGSIKAAPARHLFLVKQTSEQTNERTDRRTNKQTNEQTNKQTNEQTNKRTNK